MTPSLPHVLVILGSTREGRRGETVARWFAGLAGERDDLTSELVDLRDWPFPFLSARVPPSRGLYEDPLTIAWAAKVASADGFVLVTPEYNHGYPAVLKNALDVIFAEWSRKPVSFVGYGGSAGGVRAVEQLRQVAVELGLAPLRRQVTIARVGGAFDETGRPREEYHDASAGRLLDELAWWARALAAARDSDALQASQESTTG